MTFAKWIDTFLSEKGIDAEETLIVEGAMGECRRSDREADALRAIIHRAR